MKGAGAVRIVVALAGVALVAVVTAAVAVTAAVYGQHMRGAQQRIMTEAPERYAEARPRYASPEATADIAFAPLRTPGWQLRLHPPDPPGAPPGISGPGNPMPEIGRQPPPLGAVAALIGIIPRRVQLVDAQLDIVPDLDAFGADLAGMGLAAALALVVGAAGIWRFGRSAERAALEPLAQTTEALRRLAAHDFTPRLILTDDRSAIGELARAYNDAAEQVARAIRERDAAESEMQRFLADAGHELRTPVTIVMGYLEILRGMTPADNATADRVVNGMRAEMDRMRRLTEKLIVLSRLESTPAERRMVDAVTVVASVRDSLSALAGERAIAIDAPPSAAVLGDENDLHEALANLVDNALKYAPDSDVRISVQVGDDAVTIAVADRGPGMDAADLRRAFERFHRGGGRTAADGSGLGLAIVKRAVERCGGSVSATSTLGNGACFTLVLPRPNGEHAA